MSYTFNPFTGNLDVTPFSLDGAGKIPSNYLPSYVDDVVEYDDLAGFPGTGETGKIYVAKDTGYTYRWTGSVYVRIGSGGEVELNLGSAGSPSLFFNGDANTGLYSPGADQVAISTNGTGRLFVDASGNVGVGTGSPSVKLEVSGAANANEIRSVDGTVNSQWYQDQNGYSVFGTFSNHPQVFRTNGTERLRITADGKLGLGTSSPGERLAVAGNIAVEAAQPYIFLADSGWSAGTTIRSGVNTLGTGTGNYQLFNVPTGKGFAFAQNNTANSLVIDSSNRVGIGASSPAQLLHIKGSGDAKLLLNSSNNASERGIYFATSTDSEVLGYIKQEYSTGKFEISSGSGTYSSSISFRTGGTADRVVIDSTGKVGIGTTSPGSLLTLRQTAASHQIIEISRPNSDIGALYLGNDTNNNAVIAANNSDIRFGTDVSGTFTERARIDSSGRLLVGTSSSTSALNKTIELHSNGVATGQPSFETYAYPGPDAASAGRFSFYKSRGSSVGSNVIVSNGDVLGYLHWLGANGTGYDLAARISAEVDGVPSASGDMPGRLVFSTTADSASSPTERVRITSIGSLRCYTDTTGVWSATGAAAGTSIKAFVVSHSATGVASGTESLRIFSNGNVENTNNSYGAISDIKLKENIVDATSQWDDIKALRPVNYNFKEGQTHTQLGLIAQEVELVSPGLVSESPDRDEDENDLGTVTKSVNYSVLYMKAVKALQEAMERIETLEAKVAALEAS